MSKNSPPLLFGVSSRCLAVGGQAVLEGVMIRKGDFSNIAIRDPRGGIVSAKLPWRSLDGFFLLSAPFIRGFIILLESIVNGVIAVNFSAKIADRTKPAKNRLGRNIISLIIAIALAFALFIIAPHFLAFFMLSLGLGSDVNLPSFHLWDGFFKCALFILYIFCISLVPEIYRLLQYHGAEHKIVSAYENGYGLDYFEAEGMSRLHPRCGTTFILFVICVSIITQGALVPLILKLWLPDSLMVKHLWTIFIKLVLVVPVSGISYEIIRFASSLGDGFWARLLLWPGLSLQRLTTREPDRNQLEVAAAALYTALKDDNSPNSGFC